MTREEAERMLAEWRDVTHDRDNRVRAAVDAGVSKYRVARIAKIGRSTIDRIIGAAPAGAANVQPESSDEC
jgi:DNA invertase Pin-like site-specific DNA recombinase